MIIISNCIALSFLAYRLFFTINSFIHYSNETRNTKFSSIQFYESLQVLIKLSAAILSSSLSRITLNRMKELTFEGEEPNAS